MELGKLCLNVVEIARSAGDFIREEAGKFDRSRIEYKGLNDMVSYVDKGAEERLVNGLQKLLPECTFITEEQTISQAPGQLIWIIDPLDGTTNFIHGIPTYSVSIGLQKDDELVLGVVYEVNRDEAFYAWKDGGAFLNGNRISVSSTPAISQSLLATGFPYYDFERQEQYLDLMRKLMQSCHGLRRIGSAAIDLAYVACGRFDAYFEYNLNSYDVAGGIVLVREAGGEVFDFSGGNDPIGNREILATNGHLSSEMLTHIRNCFPDK